MIYCAFIEKNKDTVRHVVNNQARIIGKLLPYDSLRKNFIFLELVNVSYFVLRVAHTSAPARAK